MRDTFNTMFEEGKGCKDCTERYVGCHAKCEIYIEAQKKWAQRKETIKKNKSVTLEYDKYRLKK